LIKLLQYQTKYGEGQRKISVAIGILLAGCIISLCPSPAFAYTYNNSRFGYSITVPDKTFKAMPEAYNGDGRVFVSRTDPSVTITVYAGYNIFNYSVEEEMNSRVPDTVTWLCKDAYDGYFILGYTNDGNTTHMAAMLFGNTFYTVMLKAPTVKLELYLPIWNKAVSTWKLW